MPTLQYRHETPLGMAPRAEAAHPVILLWPVGFIQALPLHFPVHTFAHIIMMSLLSLYCTPEVIPKNSD